MSLKIRLLACFPKTFAPEDEPGLIRQAHAQIKSRLALDCDIVSSRDWYEKTFPSAFDYRSWVHTTASGRDYITQEPNFRGFVIFSDRIGKITAEIVSCASSAKKVVLLCRGDKLFSVEAVNEIDSNDWKTGWSVSVNPIGE